ncbi:MAG: winged helix-turn-helix domain-containing protein [Dokdonella sp.]
MNLHVSPQRATDDLLTQSNLRLRIGEHVIDVGALRVITRPELPRLTSKAVAVLIELVRHVGATVTRDELLDRVWTGRFTTPDVLTQAIKELRRAFADDSKPPLYIETIPKVGYRLIAPVLVLDGPAAGVFVESAVAQSLDGGPLDEAPIDVPDAQTARAAVPPPRKPASRLVKWLLPAALLAILGLAAVMSVNRLWHPGAAAGATWQVSDTHALTSDPGSEYRPHLSPDGTRVAFSIFDPASQFERLVVRGVEPSQLTRLTSSGSEVEGLPVWSPDGTRIAFLRLGPNHCELFVVPSMGGSERDVGNCRDYGVSYFDWAPDGHSLLTAGRLGDDATELVLFTWNIDSGKKQALSYARTAQDQDLDPRYSPDGRWIAFRRGIAPYSDLFIMSSKGGAVRQLTKIAARIRGYTWMADNRTLVFSSDLNASAPALYALDVETGQTQALGISPAQYPDAGRSGNSVVYEITRTQDKLQVMPLDASGVKPRVLAPSTGSDFTPVLSPSGDRVAFVSDRSGRFQLWLHDLASATTTQLTERTDADAFGARWSADGKQIIFVQRDAQVRQLIELDLASARQRVLSRPDEHIMFGAYGMKPDRYLFAVRSGGRKTALIEVDHPATPNETRKTLVPGIAYAQVDPLTRSVYYTSNATDGLFRRDLDNGAERLVLPKISSSLGSGWQIVDGHVWYLTDIGIRSAVMHDFDPANGEDREVRKLDLLLQDFSFSITPQHDAIIFAPVDVEDTDIGTFRLTRTPAA